LAKSLGIEDATVESGLRADVKKNLEREVKFRVLARNKAAVMDALVAKAELDLPKAAGRPSWSAWSKAPVPT
jgi:trigger factor